MANIPSKQLHRSGTLEDLQANLSNREIGFCTTDHLAYYKLNGILFPMGSGIIPDPTEKALFMAYDDPEHPGEYIYDWKSLESIEPIPNNPLKLWSRLAGMGLYAEVASKDSKGRKIADTLDKKTDATDMTPGTYTKVSVNEQGAVTNGGGLEASDLPTHEHSAEDITSGTLDPDRIGDGSVPVEKLEIHKRLYVDGTTISATETDYFVVISVEPKLSDMIHKDNEGTGEEITLPKSLVSVPGGYNVKKGFYVPYPGNPTCLGRIVDVDDSETPPTCTIELCGGWCDELNRRVDLSNAVIPLDLNASSAENEYTRAVELCDAGVVPVLQYMVTYGVAYARLSSSGSWGLRFTGCDGFTVTQITISTTYAVSVDSRTIPVS